MTMISSRSLPDHRGSSGSWIGPVLLVATALLLAAPAAAWVDLEQFGAQSGPMPDGSAVTDGSYVMNVGELHMNITNFGLIGSQTPATCSWCDAPSAQWPAGSGVEYLWAAGLWVGGVVLGERLVSTGQYETEIRARNEILDTIYEAVGGRVTRPAGYANASGKRRPESGANDDDDRDFFGEPLYDEETLNGYDDDEDGEIEEDFGQIGNQMMVCTMYDNTRLAGEQFPDHTPINLKIVQKSFAWENDDADDFVAFEFDVTNVGVASVDDVYIGFFADADIGPRARPGRAEDDMAGSRNILVRARDNSWVPVSVGFMFDSDGDEGATPGYFGIVFLGHDTDPTGRLAPRNVGLRSFNHFSGNQPFARGGDPSNDAERYELLSEPNIDNDTTVGKESDYRFLISAGPFSELPPGETLQFQAAIVVGNGLEGMLQNAAEAMLTWIGNAFNLDGDNSTGVLGRETKICARDYGQNMFSFVADLMDTTCVAEDYVLSQPVITSGDLDSEGCIYVNMDNCFECVRQAGEFCTKENRLIETLWSCYRPEGPTAGCTGVDGNESLIHWLVGMAPPPPGVRLWPTDSAVHVFWDNRSETTPDVRANRIDFESYRVWRADNWTRPFGSSVENGPESNLWQLIAEYDYVNSYINTRTLGDGTTVVDTLPLGANTGLERIRYRPRVLDDPTFAGLAEAMRQVVEADTAGRYVERPALYDREGLPIPALAGLLPWQGYPAALDTFFMVTGREELLPSHSAKLPLSFYEYTDPAVHNGFLYFYSVTATDHAIRINPNNTLTVIGSGLVGDPGSSFTHTNPGSNAQSVVERERDGANIFVYPNPATREALAEFQQFSPNSDDPTGVRVNFTNLPRARNTVKIFTLDGDLVETIEHDGTGGYGETSWNLVSRNGQEVVSEIYLFTVQSDDDRFEDFIGKFVVIR
jgi:hypothetical protein